MNYKSTKIKNRKIQMSIPLTSDIESKLNTLSPADIGIDPEYVITDIKVNSKNVLKPFIQVTAERSPEMTFEKIQEAVKNINPAKLKPYNIVKKDSKEVMALINMYDFHLGRLAHAPEVYGHSYDSKIACKIFRENSENIFSELKAMPWKIDTLVLNYGGDFFNADNEDNMTSSLAHDVDTDTRYYDYYQKGVELMVNQIQEGLKIADKIFIPMVPGNHDHQTLKTALLAVHYAFQFEPRVFVELDDNNRSIIKYHNNLIVLTHGVEGKRIPFQPMTEPEAREYISECSNVEVISGHVHNPSEKYYDWGIKHEICDQMCPVADSWTAEMGYSESRGGCTVNIYDSNGRIAKLSYSLRDYLDAPEPRGRAWDACMNFTPEAPEAPKAKKATKKAPEKATKKTAKASKTTKTTSAKKASSSKKSDAKKAAK